MTTLLISPPSLRIRVKIFFGGSAFHHSEARGRGTVDYRSSKCKWHGYYIDTPHGFLRYMECPICRKARLERKPEQAGEKETKETERDGSGRQETEF